MIISWLYDHYIICNYHTIYWLLPPWHPQQPQCVHPHLAKRFIFQHLAFPYPFVYFLQVSLGTVKQCEMALSRITASLSFFIHEYKQLASYRAQVDRLYDFRCCGLAFMKDCNPEDIGGHCGHAMKHTSGGCPSFGKHLRPSNVQLLLVLHRTSKLVSHQEPQSRRMCLMHRCHNVDVKLSHLKDVMQEYCRVIPSFAKFHCVLSFFNSVFDLNFHGGR